MKKLKRKANGRHLRSRRLRFGSPVLTKTFNLSVSKEQWSVDGEKLERDLLKIRGFIKMEIRKKSFLNLANGGQGRSWAWEGGKTPASESRDLKQSKTPNGYTFVGLPGSVAMRYIQTVVGVHSVSGA